MDGFDDLFFLVDMMCAGGVCRVPVRVVAYTFVVTCSDDGCR
jgi:hypothetical protein